MAIYKEGKTYRTEISATCLGDFSYKVTNEFDYTITVVKDAVDGTPDGTLVEGVARTSE